MVQSSYKNDTRIAEILQSDTFTYIAGQIEQYKANHASSKTSQLWFQYIKAIEIFLRFLKAERASNWKLHLQVACEMIPYFIASGHYLYAKSTYLYLQTMADLPITHPEVQRRFEQGYHTIRRSDRFWAGLSPDLIIEQVLMHSIKPNGGSTRGRGINELQRAIWLLSTPARAEVNRAMQEFTTVTFVTSDQHKYVSDTRIERDHQDSLRVSHYLSEHFPFELGDDLISIENGEVADNSLNVYK